MKQTLFHTCRQKGPFATPGPLHLDFPFNPPVFPIFTVCGPGERELY